jgi:hypothetical protein
MFAGVLNKEWRIRFLNWSLSGCLIESPTRIDVGSVVSVTLVIDGCEFIDQMQVVRCQALEGSSSLCHVGAQFLWTTATDSRSLRSIVSYLSVDGSAAVGRRQLFFDRDRD